MNLFSELKRRNVFRVAGVYAVVGWLVAQIVALAANSFAAPDWVMQMLIVALVVGLPIAMVFAWAFEMTPNGVKRTEAVAEVDSIAEQTGRKLDFAILGGLMLVAALAIFQILQPAAPGIATPDSITPQTHKETPTAQLAETEQEKSIAVLPFVNMSSDPEQEYFADGISEEILNVLVRIPKLKVAGRTSSFSFKGKNEDLRKIGEALDVNHILEGSVRRSGVKLRITAQLIRSDDGFHLWSDTYDREIADIFDIQDEIAKDVADKLAISLGLDGYSRAQERTEDLLVYENYLKAKQLYLERGRDNLDTALALLNEATQKDPDYAPAWAVLASVYSVYGAYVPVDEAKEKDRYWQDLGRSAAERAIELDPELAEAIALVGVFYYYDFDFITAYEYYDRALALAPDSHEILDIVAQSGHEVGYFDESLQAITRASEIDPLVPMYRNGKAWAYRTKVELEKAIVSANRAIELDPTLEFPYNNLRFTYADLKNLEGIRATIKRAVDNGAYPDEYLEAYQPLFDIIDKHSATEHEAALRQLVQQTSNQELELLILNYLKDVNGLIAHLEKNNWDRPFRTNPGLFWIRTPDYYANQRWKEQVRKDGVLALWQSRGFPTHCKPVGDDDFECE